MARKGGCKPPGRPRGSRNKFSRAAAARLAQSAGMLPHEFLAQVAVGEPFEIGDETIMPSLNQRIGAARAAAPYYAPKLHSVAVSLPAPQDMDDAQIIEELRATLAALSASAKTSP